MRLPALLTAPPRSGPEPRFAAQALGAGGERRGLRAGRGALDVARAAYLQVQWSGGERRRAPGRGAALRV